MGPIELSNWALQLWCCILSFSFISIIWLIPFCFVLFLIVFLFYQGRRYQNDPEFKWGDMGVTFIFYFLILLVAHLFLRIWDFLGIPIDHIMNTLQSSGTGTTAGAGSTCLISWNSIDIYCCSRLTRYNEIRPIIELLVNIIILFTKLISFVGTIAMIFYWGYSRYKQAKPGFMSGHVHIYSIVAQAIIAGFVIIIFLSLIFYAYEKLLFFNIKNILQEVIGCIITTTN